MGNNFDEVLKVNVEAVDNSDLDLEHVDWNYFVPKRGATTTNNNIPVIKACASSFSLNAYCTNLFGCADSDSNIVYLKFGFANSIVVMLSDEKDIHSIKFRLTKTKKLRKAMNTLFRQVFIPDGQPVTYYPRWNEKAKALVFTTNDKDDR